ncbi:MAG: CpsD/CapB family tyrosine-protein kinase [Gammaproteobacteria bacterium]
MERIKQAVEQARKERQQAGGDARIHKVAAAQSRVEAPGSDSSENEFKITYSETRSVGVNLAVRERNRLVAAIPGHALQDTYRMLRTRVLQEMRANNWTTIGVTSPNAETGKTLTAINLAISIARDKSSSCLLFDADLRNPTTAESFGYKPEFGLNDYLFDDVPLSKVLFHPEMDRLTVLPGRERIYESAETLSSPKFVSLLDEVSNRYKERIVIVDLAPTLEFDDVLTVAPNIDCILMVAESGETKHEELSKALELLQGNEILGTVLNKVDKKVKESVY